MEVLKNLVSLLLESYVKINLLEEQRDKLQKTVEELEKGKNHWIERYTEKEAELKAIDKFTKYLQLVHKIQCASCKLGRYDQYCTECVKGVEESNKQIEYWREAYENLLEKFYGYPRDTADGSGSDDGQTGRIQ